MKWASMLAEPGPMPAALEAAATSLEAGLGLGGSGPAGPDLVLVFVTPDHAGEFHRIPELLHARWPRAAILGCSAGGVVGGGREVERRPGLALTAAVLPGVQVHPFHADGASLPLADAPGEDWEALTGVPAGQRAAFIILPDPYTCDVDQLLQGLDRHHPGSVKLGGLPSGGSGPGLNALFLGGRVHPLGCVGVSLRGDIDVEAVVSQGARPIGPPHQVTRSEANLLFELDGRPAAEALHRLYTGLGEEERELFREGLCLGLGVGEPGEYLVRNLVGLDPEAGVLAVGAELRDGLVVRFHVRDARSGADDLRDRLKRSGARAPAPSGALLFSCLGRGEAFFGRPDHDSTLIAEQMGPLPIGGFFCGGEIGPVGGRTFLHGYTSSIALVRPS